MTTMPGRHRSTDPAAPLRVTSTAGGLQVDASSVPSGSVRIAVIDQDERDYDLVLRAADDQDVLGRIPPASDDRGRELLTRLAPGRYVLAADAPGDELRAEFTVQPPQ